MNNAGLVLLLVLVLATAWLVAVRFQVKPDNNWPLLYYFALVAYMNYYGLAINPYVVYVAVISALLLRFEFMNPRLILFVRMIEVVSLLVIGYALAVTLQKALR